MHLLEQLLAQSGASNTTRCTAASNLPVMGAAHQGSPVAYVATTLRNESTLQSFIDAVAAVPVLGLEDITGLIPSFTVQFEHHIALDRSILRLHKVYAAAFMAMLAVG